MVLVNVNVKTSYSQWFDLGSHSQGSAQSAAKFCSVSPNRATFIGTDTATTRWSQPFSNPRIIFTSFIDYFPPLWTYYRWFHYVLQTMPLESWDQNQVKLSRFVSQFPYISQPVLGTIICYRDRGKSAICNPTCRAYKRLPKLNTGLMSVVLLISILDSIKTSKFSKSSCVIFKVYYLLICKNHFIIEFNIKKLCFLLFWFIACAFWDQKISTSYLYWLLHHIPLSFLCICFI